MLHDGEEVRAERLACREARRMNPLEHDLRQRFLNEVDFPLGERPPAGERPRVHVFAVEGHLVPDPGRVRGGVVPGGQHRREGVVGPGGQRRQIGDLPAQGRHAPGPGRRIAFRALAHANGSILALDDLGAIPVAVLERADHPTGTTAGRRRSAWIGHHAVTLCLQRATPGAALGR